MQQHRLSVVIVTHNEEAYIGECLRSVEWADEIIVVDGQSTDRTAEIAQGHADHVIVRPNAMNPEVNKNIGITQATGDWILLLDADECVEESLRGEIGAVLNHQSDFVAYWIPRKNYVFGQWMQHGGLYPDYQLRLVRSGYGSYPGLNVHEPLTVQDATGYLHGHIIHIGTVRSFAQWIDKANRFTTVEANRRRQAAASSTLRAVAQTLQRFVSVFILQQGFRDGWLGFCWAGLAAVYEFIVVLKSWEAHSAGER